MTRVAAALTALALALAAPVPAVSAGPAESVAAAGARVKSAAVAAAAPTPAARAELASALIACEAALAEMRGSVAEAAAREARLGGALEAQRVEVGRLLATLEALSLSQAQEGPALHPGGPVDAARARMMLATLSPELAARAQALSAQLREISAARQVAALGFDNLAAGLDQLDAGREVLLAALAAPAEVRPEGEAPAFTREAVTLSELADTFAGKAEKRDAVMTLRWPVVGVTRSGFREPDAAGARLPGVRIAAAPLALVVAPAGGRVRYAGPFLEYGYVVVLEPRADVLIVLAGLSTLAVQTDGVVESGALLGLLGGRPLDAQEFLMTAEPGNEETRAETLYIELRHGRGPVDPAPWFQGRNG
jgi:septal ring factor EnvC (AmiA/AmiB activator)